MSYRIVVSNSNVSDRIKKDAKKHPKILNKSLNRLAYFGKIDAQESMKQELDRPKPFTLRAIQYKRSTIQTLSAKVYVNKNNNYLHYLVYGGVRRNSGKILIPATRLRSDRYGNLSRARRKRIVNDPKTFKSKRGRTEVLMQRKARNTQFVGALVQQARYKGGTWRFHESGLNTYDRRFPTIFKQEFNKEIR